MRTVVISSLFMFAMCNVVLAQEVLIDSILGDILIDNDGIYSCQLSGSQLCASCIEDFETPNSGIQPLVISFGQPNLFGWSFGTISGTIQVAVELDGLTIPPALLPCNSYFSSRIGVAKPFVPNSPCAPQGLNYVINSNSGSFTDGGNREITIPVEEANLVSFEFDFCNMSVHWGAGCNLNGSFNDRWLLHAPGMLNAADVQAGDPAPLDFPNQGVAVDFEQSGGGTITVLRSELAAPGNSAPAGPAGYWEIRTDMPDGTYSVAVTLNFDPATLPSGMDPLGLMLARFDTAQNGWESLMSAVDMSAGTVTATMSGLSKLVLTTENVVSIRETSWGEIKAQY